MCTTMHSLDKYFFKTKNDDQNLMMILVNRSRDINKDNAFNLLMNRGGGHKITTWEYNTVPRKLALVDYKSFKIQFSLNFVYRGITGIVFKKYF